MRMIVNFHRFTYGSVKSKIRWKLISLLLNE